MLSKYYSVILYKVQKKNKYRQSGDFALSTSSSILSHLITPPIIILAQHKALFYKKKMGS